MTRSDHRRSQRFGLATVSAFVLVATQAVAGPLLSWNDDPTEQSIVEFVAQEVIYKKEPQTSWAQRFMRILPIRGQL